LACPKEAAGPGGGTKEWKDKTPSPGKVFHRKETSVRISWVVEKGKGKNKEKNRPFPGSIRESARKYESEGVAIPHRGAHVLKMWVLQGIEQPSQKPCGSERKCVRQEAGKLPCHQGGGEDMAVRDLS